MRILSKGSSTCRSLSPVMMQEASAATANSRSILSFGSRQAEIGGEGTVQSKACFSKYDRKLSRCSKEMKGSNLERTNTADNSEKVSGDITMRPRLMALSKALAGLSLPRINALTNVLVSNTKSLVIFTKQLFENFFCQSVVSGFLTKIGKGLFKFTLLGQADFLLHSHFGFFGELPLQSRRQLLPGRSHLAVDFQYDSFHNYRYYKVDMIQKTTTKIKKKFGSNTDELFFIPNKQI